MPKHRVILRFGDRASRDTFVRNLLSTGEMTSENIVLGAIFPDAIVSELNDDMLAKVKETSSGQAKLIEDFTHTPQRK